MIFCKRNYRGANDSHFAFEFSSCFIDRDIQFLYKTDQLRRPPKTIVPFENSHKSRSNDDKNQRRNRIIRLWSGNCPNSWRHILQWWTSFVGDHTETVMSRSAPINLIHQMASGFLIGDERLAASCSVFLRTRMTSKDPGERWHSQTITEFFSFRFRRGQ